MKFNVARKNLILNLSEKRPISSIDRPSVASMLSENMQIIVEGKINAKKGAKTIFPNNLANPFTALMDDDDDAGFG